MNKRIPVIAGNWKMNLGAAEARSLVDGIRYGLPFPGEVEVVVAPPFLCLAAVAEHLKNSYIAVAAQDLFFEDQGAFTGACSGKQVKEAGTDYVILGHSERRQYFNETDEIINKKVKAAYRNHLIPILCVGETLDQREANRAPAVVQRQLNIGLEGINAAEAAQLLVAYEPVWAIGTGKSATPQQVEEMHGIIRNSMVDSFGDTAARQVRILYGGSVKPGNCRELFLLADVDGALVGGASLDAADFIEIIKKVPPAARGGC